MESIMRGKMNPVVSLEARLISRAKEPPGMGVYHSVL